MSLHLRRVATVAAVAALLLLAGLALLLRSLASGDLRTDVAGRLSSALGQPVSIGRIGVTLFPLALSGTAVRVGETRAQAPAIDVARVRIVPRLSSLIAGDVFIEQLALEGFVVSVLRDHDGTWQVPRAVPAPTAPGAAGPAIERVRITDGRIRVFDRARSGEVREASSIDDLDAEVGVEQSGLRLSPITGRIGGAGISGEARSDAATVLLDFKAEAIDDDDLPSFVRLLGGERPEFLRLGDAAAIRVAVRVDRATSRLSGRGTLRAPRVRLEPVEITRFEAPFVIDGPRLSFEPTTFALYRGSHEGTVTVQLSENPAAWTADSRVRGLNAGEFLEALAGADQRLDGTASVTTLLRGRLGESLRTVSGRMRMDVTAGVIRGFPLVASLNRALRLAEGEGADTRFERLSGTFAIASGRGTTEDLVLEAGHVRLEASGWIAADRSLELRGVAAFSPERSAQAIGSVRELARFRRGGRLEVPLTITGTLDAPAFGMDLEGAVRRGLADELRRRLRGIIRR